MDDINEVATRFRDAYWAVVHNLDVLRLQVWEGRGLTLPQLRILFYVRAHPGTTTHALATRLGLTMATISGLVEKLVRAGLIERRQHEDDRRVLPLWLTSDGQAVVGEIRQGNRAYLSGLATALSDDLVPVTAALERLVGVIERQPALDTVAASEATPESVSMPSSEAAAEPESVPAMEVGAEPAMEAGVEPAMEAGVEPEAVR